MTAVEIMEKLKGKVYWDRGESIEDFFPENEKILSIPIKGETDNWGWRTSGRVYVSHDAAFLEVVIWHIDFGNHEYYYFPVDVSENGFALSGEVFSWDKTVSRDNYHIFYEDWELKFEYDTNKVNARDLLLEFGYVQATGNGGGRL